MYVFDISILNVTIYDYLLMLWEFTCVFRSKAEPAFLSFSRLAPMELTSTSICEVLYLCTAVVACSLPKSRQPNQMPNQSSFLLSRSTTTASPLPSYLQSSYRKLTPEYLSNAPLR